MPSPVSATVDGVTVESSHGTAEDLAASLAAPAPEPVTETSTATAKPQEPPVETPTDDEPDPDPASEAGKTLSKRGRDLQERLNKATWRFREEERKREAAEAELAQLKTPKPAAQPEASGRPLLKDYISQIGTTYDTYEDAVDAHVDALSDYKLAARDQASNAERQTHARQQTLHHLHTQGAAAHADFDAVLGHLVQNGGTLAPRNAAEAQGPLGDLEQVIFQHPRGHTIAYEVAKDADLYQRLLTAPSRVMFMAEMGKLITRLDDAPPGSSSQAAPVSKAKPPVKPVGGQPHATGGVPGDDASDEEHRLYYNQQEISRRRRA